MKNNYDSFPSWKWKTFNDGTLIDPEDFIKDHMDYMFFVGTDSQNYKRRGSKHTCFTSAIVAYKMGTGGLSIIHDDKTDFIESLRQRLLMEAMRSLECAWFMDQTLSEKNAITIARPQIHLDVNTDHKHDSSRYRQELVGLITAQGFEAVCKPYAWAASCLADRRC